MFYKLVIIAVFSLISFNLQAKCVPGGINELKRSLKTKQAEEIIFFASWCSQCMDKLISARDAEKKFVLVSIWDSLERSNEVINYLKLSESTCIFDSGDIARAYKVKSLPFSAGLGTVLEF